MHVSACVGCAGPPGVSLAHLVSAVDPLHVVGLRFGKTRHRQALMSEEEAEALCEECGEDSPDGEGDKGDKEVSFSFLGRYMKRYYPNTETVTEMARRMEQSNDRFAVARRGAERLLRLRLP